MFTNFPQDDCEIVAKGGGVRGTKAIFGGTTITIPDPSVQIEVGDEIRRRLPNGLEEVFEVQDPQFHSNFHGIPAHFQVKVRRKGQHPRGTGGNYNIHLHGSYNRVNLNSVDNSKTITHDGAVFSDLTRAVENSSLSSEEKINVTQAVRAMEAAVGKPSFTTAYQNFVATVANHMQIAAPFLPALSKLLGG